MCAMEEDGRFRVGHAGGSGPDRQLVWYVCAKAAYHAGLKKRVQAESTSGAPGCFHLRLQSCFPVILGTLLGSDLLSVHAACRTGNT